MASLIDLSPELLIAEILPQVKIKTLEFFCAINNRYLARICQDDYLWRLRLRNDYDLNRPFDRMTSRQTWQEIRELYQILVKHFSGSTITEKEILLLIKKDPLFAKSDLIWVSQSDITDKLTNKISEMASLNSVNGIIFFLNIFKFLNDIDERVYQSLFIEALNEAQVKLINYQNIEGIKRLKDNFLHAPNVDQIYQALLSENREIFDLVYSEEGIDFKFFIRTDQDYINLVDLLIDLIENPGILSREEADDIFEFLYVNSVEDLNYQTNILFDRKFEERINNSGNAKAIATIEEYGS